MENYYHSTFTKKGDLKDPNNWQGLTLLDMISKIVSMFLNNRLQCLIKIYGAPYQLGATPFLGCLDTAPALKPFFKKEEKMA